MATDLQISVSNRTDAGTADRVLKSSLGVGRGRPELPNIDFPRFGFGFVQSISAGTAPPAAAPRHGPGWVEAGVQNDAAEWQK